MIFDNRKIPFAQFEGLNVFQNKIIHFITTRNSSLPPLSSNNFTIKLNGEVDNEVVLSNRKQLADQLGFSNASYVFASQVHGKGVAVVKDEDKGKGAFDRASYLDNIDAMVTKRKGICLVAQAADCVPILFYDPKNKAIGVAHAGWKGTIAKIASEVIKTMNSEYGSKPSDLIVGIGPSIGPCCYEVGGEVVQQVLSTFGSTQGMILEDEETGKTIFNLWETNRRVLVEAGVKFENIELSGLCTKCNKDFFFSARAGDMGRFGAGIMLR